MFSFRLLLITLMIFFGLEAFTQVVPVEIPAAAPAISGIEETIIDIVLNWLKGHPWFASIVLVQSFGRNIFKPLHALIDAFILSTPGTKDNETWAAFTKSKVYWFIDYMFSLKLPK